MIRRLCSQVSARDGLLCCCCMRRILPGGAVGEGAPGRANSEIGHCFPSAAHLLHRTSRSFAAANCCTMDPSFLLRHMCALLLPRCASDQDLENPDHLSWLFQASKARAEKFGIEGVTYRLTTGVSKVRNSFPGERLASSGTFSPEGPPPPYRLTSVSYGIKFVRCDWRSVLSLR